MRILVAAVLLAFLSVPALAQSADSLPIPDSLFLRYCEAPRVSSGAEVERVAAITRRLGVANPHITVAVTYSARLNAWNVKQSSSDSLICVPMGLVRFMGSEGELAFILGHEIGHASDDRCKDPDGRARVADESKPGTALALLFGHGSGDGAREQRACETRADEFGLNLITRAGYDPEDAAAALGRISGYFPGDNGAGLFERFAALRNEHPLMADRIRHLHKLIEHPRSARPTQSQGRKLTADGIQPE